MKVAVVDMIQHHVNTNKARTAANLTGLYFLKKVFSKEILNNKEKVNLSIKNNNKQLAQMQEDYENLT